jgi:hypothetical protein
MVGRLSFDLGLRTHHFDNNRVQFSCYTTVKITLRALCPSRVN